MIVSMVLSALLLLSAVLGLLIYRRYVQVRAELIEREKDCLRHQERLLAAQEKAQELTNQIEALQSQSQSVQDQLEASKREQAVMASEYRAQSQALNEKTNFLETLQQELKTQFKHISDQALNQNIQSFLDLAQKRFDQLQKDGSGALEERQKAIQSLIEPLKQSLTQVDEKISLLEKNRIGAYSGLTEQVQHLLQTQRSLQNETNKLVDALKTPHVRGQWGELQLKRCVELAGMLEHCDFSLQESQAQSESGLLRPDLVVSLPNGRKLIVDAKTPLEAYLKSLSAENPDQRALELKRHAQHIRTHISQLSSKGYWRQFDNSPDFVILFIPGEVFFSAALEQDPELLQFGVREKVILATPTTLIALLKSVAYGWQQDSLTQKARQISELGRQLYERLMTFGTHFSQLGRQLDRSVESYNKLLRSAETRLFVTARKFEQLDIGLDASAQDLELIEKRSQAPTQLETLCVE